jgi:hypothetical protein
MERPKQINTKGAGLQLGSFSIKKHLRPVFCQPDLPGNDNNLLIFNSLQNNSGIGVHFCKNHNLLPFLSC